MLWRQITDPLPPFHQPVHYVSPPGHDKMFHFLNHIKKSFKIILSHSQRERRRHLSSVNCLLNTYPLDSTLRSPLWTWHHHHLCCRVPGQVWVVRVCLMVCGDSCPKERLDGVYRTGTQVLQELKEAKAKKTCSKHEKQIVAIKLLFSQKCSSSALKELLQNLLRYYNCIKVSKKRKFNKCQDTFLSFCLSQQRTSGAAQHSK